MKRLIFLLMGIGLLILTSCQPQTPSKLTPIDREIQSLKETVDQLQRQVDELTKRLKSLEENATSTANELKTTSERVNALDGMVKTNLASITDLSDRTARLENTVDALNSRFSKFQMDSTAFEEALKRDITLLQQRQQNTDKSLARLKEGLSTLEARYIELNSEISKLKVENPLLSSVKLIFGKLNDFETKLNSLSYEQSTLKEDIEKRVDVIDAEYAELSQRLKHLEEETKRNFEIISQISTSTDSKVDIEGIIGYITNLKKRIDELQNTYDAQLSDIASFKEGVYSYISKQILPLKGHLENLSRQLESSSQTVTKLKKELSSMKTGLEQIKLSVSNAQAIETGPATVVTIPSEDVEKLKKELKEVRSEMENRWFDVIKNLKELEVLMRPDQDLKELLSLEGGMIEYRIKKGDTLAEISYAFGLGDSGIDELIRINNISDPRRLQVGQIIKIPVKDVASLFTWPLATTKRVDFKDIVGYFGQNVGGAVNPGLEIRVPIQDTVRSILPGKVILVVQTDGFYSVRVYHGGGLVSGYSNLASVRVKEGEMVKAGQPIGRVGKAPEGYLLRFEIWKDGEPKDPMRILYKLAGNFEITFYTEWEDGKTVYDPDFRVTSSGAPPKPWYTVAADPSIFPMGTVLYIPDLARYTNGRPFFVVEDTGGAIKGSRLDIYVDDIDFAANNKIVCEVYYWGS